MREKKKGRGEGKEEVNEKPEGQMKEMAGKRRTGNNGKGWSHGSQRGWSQREGVN